MPFRRVCQTSSTTTSWNNVIKQLVVVVIVVVVVIHQSWGSVEAVSWFGLQSCTGHHSNTRHWTTLHQATMSLTNKNNFKQRYHRTTTNCTARGGVWESFSCNVWLSIRWRQSTWLSRWIDNNAVPLITNYTVLATPFCTSSPCHKWLYTAQHIVIVLIVQYTTHPCILINLLGETPQGDVWLGDRRACAECPV